MTPEEFDRLAYLESKYSEPTAPEPERPGWWKRFGQKALTGLANIPADIEDSLASIPTPGIGGRVVSETDRADFSSKAEGGLNVGNPFNVPQAKTGMEQSADIVGSIPAMIVEAALTEGIAGGGIVGSLVSGGYLGSQQNKEEAALQASEFGALGAASKYIPNRLLRTAASLAIPAAGAAIRGHNLTDPATAAQIGVMGLMGSGIVGEGLNAAKSGARSLLKKTPGYAEAAESAAAATPSAEPVSVITPETNAKLAELTRRQLANRKLRNKFDEIPEENRARFQAEIDRLDAEHGAFQSQKDALLKGDQAKPESDLSGGLALELDAEGNVANTYKVDSKGNPIIPSTPKIETPETSIEIQKSEYLNSLIDEARRTGKSNQWIAENFKAKVDELDAANPQSVEGSLKSQQEAISKTSDISSRLQKLIKEKTENERALNNFNNLPEKTPLEAEKKQQLISQAERRDDFISAQIEALKTERSKFPKLSATNEIAPSPAAAEVPAAASAAPAVDLIPSETNQQKRLMRRDKAIEAQENKTFDSLAQSQTIVEINGQRGTVSIERDGVYFNSLDGQSQRIYGNAPGASIKDVETPIKITGAKIESNGRLLKQEAYRQKQLELQKQKEANAQAETEVNPAEAKPLIGKGLKKPTGKSTSGAIDLRLASAIGGGVAGYTSSEQDDTVADKIGRTLLGVAAGASLPGAARRLMKPSLMRKEIEEARKLYSVSEIGRSKTENTVNEEFVKKANSTARSSGVVGSIAITPKYVASTAKPNESVLNFGAGKPDKQTGKYLHSEIVKQSGANVKEYDFGNNTTGALGEKYDTVFASNVLNVQSSPEMLQSTLSEIWSSVKDNGRAVFNYPVSPRYLKMTPREVAESIENFTGIKPVKVGGTNSAPLWEIKSNQSAGFKPLTGKPTSGAIDVQLASGVSGALAGGYGGYQSIDEDDSTITKIGKTLGGALLGAAAGASAPRTIKLAANPKQSLAQAKRMLETHIQENLTNQPANKLGAIAHWVERNLLGPGEDVRLAQAKGRGEKARLTAIAGEQIPHLKNLNDTQLLEAELYLNTSNHSPSEIAALKSSLGEDAANALIKLRGVIREGQGIYADADPTKSWIRATDTYLKRSYTIFNNPEQWSKFKASFEGQKIRQDMINQYAKSPEFAGIDIDLIARAVDDYGENLRRKATGEAPLEQSASNKIDQDLWHHRAVDPAEKQAMLDFIDVQRKTPGISNAEKARLDKQREETLKIKTLDELHRKFLGEITNPVEQAILTAHHILGSVSEAKTIFEIGKLKDEKGNKLVMDTKELSREITGAKAAGDADAVLRLNGYVKMPDTFGYGALKNTHVPREVADALNSHKQAMTKGWIPYFSAVNNMIKAAQTQYNPATHIHNWIQMPMIGMGLRVYNPITYFKAAREISRGGDMYRKMQRLGLIGADYNSAELSRASKDLQLMLSGEGSILGKAKNLMNRGHSKVGEAYGMSDAVTRVAGYMVNEARFMKEANALKPSFTAEGTKLGLSGTDLVDYVQKRIVEHAENETVKFVDKFSHNYTQVSPLTAKMRNVPFVSPFLSYQDQMAKVIKNHAIEMFRPGNSAKDRTYAALALSQFLILPLMIQKFAESKLSKEDKEDWDKTIELSPSHVRAQINIPLKRDKHGVFAKMNLGPMIPAGDFVSMAQAALRGDVESIGSSNPIIGISKTPLFTLGSEVIQGQDMFTKKKFQEPGDWFKAVAKTFSPPDVPYIGSRSEKYSRAFTRNDEGKLGVTDVRTGRLDTPTTAIASTLGASVTRINPSTVASSVKQEYQEEVQSIKSTGKRLLQTNASKEVKDVQKQKIKQKLIDLGERTKKKAEIIKGFNKKFGPAVDFNSTED